MKALLIIFVFLFASGLGAANFSKQVSGKPELIQNGPEKTRCHHCGMSLPMFYKTSHAVILKDGEKRQYCSIACLAAEYPEIRGRIKTVLVVDAKTEKLIPVQNAHYVVGSKIRGTMAAVSKIAFGSLDDAKAFQKRYGGEITDFEHAFEMAKHSGMKH